MSTSLHPERMRVRMVRTVLFNARCAAARSSNNAADAVVIGAATPGAMDANQIRILFPIVELLFNRI